MKTVGELRRWLEKMDEATKVEIATQDGSWAPIVAFDFGVETEDDGTKICDVLILVVPENVHISQLDQGGDDD